MIWAERELRNLGWLRGPVEFLDIVKVTVPSRALADESPEEYDASSLKEEGAFTDKLFHKMGEHAIQTLSQHHRLGLSGGVAPSYFRVLSRILSHKPLSPLLGTEDEWGEMLSFADIQVNKRYGSVFRNTAGVCDQITSVRFWRWERDKWEGRFCFRKIRFTHSRASTQPIWFPYAVPEVPPCYPAVLIPYFAWRKEVMTKHYHTIRKTREAWFFLRNLVVKAWDFVNKVGYKWEK